MFQRLEIKMVVCGIAADISVLYHCGADALFDTQDRSADDGGEDWILVGSSARRLPKIRAASWEIFGT